MPSLPTITSWGQLFLILLGIILAVKYIFPIIKNGNGKEDFRELRSALTLMVGQQVAMLESTKGNAELLHELAQSHQDVLKLLTEIERRTRDSEEATRIILGRRRDH